MAALCWCMIILLALGKLDSESIVMCYCYKKSNRWQITSDIFTKSDISITGKKEHKCIWIHIVSWYFGDCYRKFYMGLSADKKEIVFKKEQW